MMRAGRLAAVMLCVAVPGALLAEDTGLKRLTLRDALLGWEAVGRVDVSAPDGEGGFCTGTLIATDLVLTAAHCVFDPRDDFRPVDPARIRFRAGLRDDVSIADRNVVATVVSPAYKPGPLADADSIRHDLALLRLDVPIPAAVAAPFEVAAMPLQNRSVAVVSYAMNRAAALSIERNCAILGHDAGLFAFNCKVTFGSSGAPVFDMAGARGRIISVVSAGHQDAAGTVSYGTELPALVAELRRDLSAGRGVVAAVGTSIATGASQLPAAALARSKPVSGTGEIRAGGALFLRPRQP